MKKLLIFLSIILLVWACHKGKTRRDYIVPRDTLVSVLVDLHIADGIAITDADYKNHISKVYEKYYESVFSKHKITRAQFDSTMVYYTGRMEDLDKIYEDVMSELSVREGQLEAPKKK
jgi:hypothetical protein